MHLAFLRPSPLKLFDLVYDIPPQALAFRIANCNRFVGALSSV
jgi:hypothetical protein